MLSFCSVTVTEREHRDMLNRLQFDYDSIGSEIIYEGDDCLREFRLNPFVCSTVFQHPILSSGRASHVGFEKMYIAEDFLFKLECTLCRCRERVVRDCIYHYIVRDFSAITNRSKERMKEAIPCFMRCFQRPGQVAAE